MNANTFESMLRLILLGPPLTWQSEGDEPVCIVRTNILHTALWKPERDEDDGGLTMPGQELLMQMCFNSNNDKPRSRRFFQLNRTFSLCGRDSRVFIRPSNEPGVATIYLLARFGWEWVGIKAKTIQT